MLGENPQKSPSSMQVNERDVSTPTSHEVTSGSRPDRHINPSDATALPGADYPGVDENIGEAKDPDDPSYWPQTNYDELGESIGEAKDPDDPAYWP